jgi:hypothetical protein
MISLKVLSTAAAMALVLPMMVPTASFAQYAHGNRGGVARAAVGGGAVRMGGNAFHGAAPGAFRGGRVAGYNGGGWRGGYHRGGGFIPGAVAGAVIGGALASDTYAYYGGPGYYGYGPGYTDDQYSDDGDVVAAAPAPGGDDSVAYCMQTYRSYDPQSGTYLGYDGLRHPCP